MEQHAILRSAAVCCSDACLVLLHLSLAATTDPNAH
jgi:hypothetical protein